MSQGLGVRNVHVAFRLPDARTLSALGPVTLTIQPGEFVSLVGPSGCGKSTLLRVLAGLQVPTRGEVWVGDQRLQGPTASVAVMFQDANLMPWRTVAENVELPLELMGMGRKERRHAALELLPRLGLAEFANAYPGELSGGMAQRAALGRVLIQRPEALLLDEPFGALDALTRERISLDLLSLWMQERMTIVMITHDIHEAVLLSDRILVMSRRPGTIKADIPVLLPRPRTIDDTYQMAFGQTAAQVRAVIERS